MLPQLWKTYHTNVKCQIQRKLGVWYTRNLSVISSQVFCKSKMILKINIYLETISKDTSVVIAGGGGWFEVEEGIQGINGDGEKGSLCCLRILVHALASTYNSLSLALHVASVFSSFNIIFVRMIFSDNIPCPHHQFHDTYNI